MTDKMREVFEAWYEHPDQAELRTACAKGWAEVIWSASRAYVVVELPQIVAYEAGFDSMRDNEYASQSSEFFDADEVFALSRKIEVIEAIEAAGLKVKP